MSKTVEAIKRSPFKDDILHEHIAHTYFHQKSRKKKNKISNLNIKLITVTSSAIACIIILFVITTSFINKKYNEYMKAKLESADMITVLDGGGANKSFIRRLEFCGNAKSKSKISDDYVTLSNPKRHKWAGIGVDFKFPLNLSNRNLSLALMGKTGGEKLTIGLRDASNRSKRLSNISLTPNWKINTIPLETLRNDIDLSNISYIRMEYDYNETPSKVAGYQEPDLTVYIKNMQIVKEAKI